jgi:L-alanine-DL-glutamate epimerase-like enolase superfamily enzyme
MRLAELDEARMDGGMKFQIQRFEFRVLPMRTRFPFQYGIASLTALPHVFVHVEMVVDGCEVHGQASEGLPPKWFTKHAEMPFELEVCEMIAVIQNASRIARLAAEHETSFGAWWQALQAEQSLWAQVRQVPGLLAGLGTSLIERAVLDGLCRVAKQPLHALLRGDSLGIDLGMVRPCLKGITPREVMAAEPLPQLQARHTIGLADPLSEAEPLQDGLPHTLRECVRAYGLRFFKIKLSGKVAEDVMRLREITAILLEECGADFHVTLDGNEQFHELEEFRDFYAQLGSEPELEPLLEALLLIEQPLHRDQALGESAAALRDWKDGPAIILDESDNTLDDLPRALADDGRRPRESRPRGDAARLGDGFAARHPTCGAQWSSLLPRPEHAARGDPGTNTRMPPRPLSQAW